MGKPRIEYDRDFLVRYTPWWWDADPEDWSADCGHEETWEKARDALRDALLKVDQCFHTGATLAEAMEAKEECQK